MVLMCSSINSDVAKKIAPSDRAQQLDFPAKLRFRDFPFGYSIEYRLTQKWHFSVCIYLPIVFDQPEGSLCVERTFKRAILGFSCRILTPTSFQAKIAKYCNRNHINSHRLPCSPSIWQFPFSVGGFWGFGSTLQGCLHQ